MPIQKGADQLCRVVALEHGAGCTTTHPDAICRPSQLHNKPQLQVSNALCKTNKQHLHDSHAFFGNAFFHMSAAKCMRQNKQNNSACQSKQHIPRVDLSHATSEHDRFELRQSKNKNLSPPSNQSAPECTPNSCSYPFASLAVWQSHSKRSRVALNDRLSKLIAIIRSTVTTTAPIHWMRCEHYDSSSAVNTRGAASCLPGLNQNRKRFG